MVRLTFENVYRHNTVSTRTQGTDDIVDWCIASPQERSYSYKTQGPMEPDNNNATIAI